MFRDICHKEHLWWAGSAYLIWICRQMKQYFKLVYSHPDEVVFQKFSHDTLEDVITRSVFRTVKHLRWSILEKIVKVGLSCSKKKPFEIDEKYLWPNFIVWLPLLLEIFGNIYIAIVCFPGCDAINFGIKLFFLIKLGFFYMIEKSRQNFKYLENERILRWNKKDFSWFLKHFQLQKIVSDLRLRF